MEETSVTLDEALAAVHLPALAAALVHLTGDASLVARERRPGDPLVGDSRAGGCWYGGHAELRARAKLAMEAYLAGAPLPPQPSFETVRKMMDFVAGAEIPEHYAPFLMEELQMSGVDPKQPDWSAPKLKAAAAKLPVVVIGAGMSGLLAGIRLQQAGIPFTIVEKNADVGGTWFENSYPDCRVDNPSHLYSYSFEPNHEWPNHFSPQPVLLAYFKNVAKKHGLTAKAVISAVGQLNQPRLPDIPGRDDFKGPAFHSARWRHDLELKGKRVAVIGTGASAFQFAPEVAKQAAHLAVFQRSPPWLAPTPDYHKETTAAERWLFEHVPFYEKWYRFWLFWTLTDGVYDSTKADPSWDGGPGAVSAANAVLREALARAIAQQAGDAPELLKQLIPEYPVAGKRMLRDDGGWIAALKRENVELVTSPIAQITESGIVTEDGAARDFDVILYGTGFTASQFLKTYQVKGRGGQALHDAWAGDARAYLGIAAPGFPNFFMIYGPNTNLVVNGSIIFISECAVRYILDCLRLLAESGARALEVRQAAHDVFNEKVDAANAGMAWGSPQVTSWYKNDTGRVSQNWPFPLMDYWSATLAPDPLDFILEMTAAAPTA
jgi:4-hydroxyacetophenone monooxygenase